MCSNDRLYTIFTDLESLNRLLVSDSTPGPRSAGPILNKKGEIMRSKILFVGIILSLFILSVIVGGSADAVIITFDEPGLNHGTILNNQLFGTYGLTASALNTGGGPNLAVIFDSNRTGTRDGDLQFTGYGSNNSRWDGGNIAATPLGNLLIIQENNEGTGDGIADKPDDEGTKPAGKLTLEFATPLTAIGFDLIDIEDNSEKTEGNFATFYMGGAELATVGFAEFESGGGFDQGATFGDNFANRISPITIADLGIATPFDKVEFRLEGSGAIDNINTTAVPEPATMILVGVGLVGLAGCQRRRRKNN